MFLPSIYERAGKGKTLWLTARQMGIVADNMEHNECYPDAFIGHYTHVYYTCKWNGREVRADLSKKNGCGSIRFGLTAEEIQENRIKNAMEEEQREREKIAFMKEHFPERIERKIAIITKNLQEWRENLEEDIEYGEEESVIEADKYEIKMLEEKLKKYIE